MVFLEVDFGTAVNEELLVEVDEVDAGVDKGRVGVGNMELAGLVGRIQFRENMM